MKNSLIDCVDECAQFWTKAIRLLIAGKLIDL